MTTTTFDHDPKPATSDLLPIHPLARALPPMTPDEFALLKHDIQQQGLLEPLTVLDGAVLDGIHRQRACHELGGKHWPPRAVEYQGHAPAAFVLSRNVRRRHLSVGQQAAAGEALVLHYRSKFPKQGGADVAKVAADLGIEKVPENLGTTSAHNISPVMSLVAQAVGIQPQAIETFSTLRKQEPRLADEVRAGTKSLYGADAERKAAAKELAESTAGTRRQTKSEAAKDAERALLDAIRDVAKKVRACEAIRRDLDPSFMAGALKANEQQALEHRRLVTDISKAAA
jgi:hypothetical protein